MSKKTKAAKQKARVSKHKRKRRPNKVYASPGLLPDPHPIVGPISADALLGFAADVMLMQMFKQTGIRDGFLRMLKKQLDKDAPDQSPSSPTS